MVLLPLSGVGSSYGNPGIGPCDVEFSDCGVIDPDYEGGVMDAVVEALVLVVGVMPLIVSRQIVITL
jgi:hypothetical protein